MQIFIQSIKVENNPTINFHILSLDRCREDNVQEFDGEVTSILKIINAVSGSIRGSFIQPFGKVKEVHFRKIPFGKL